MSSSKFHNFNGQVGVTYYLTFRMTEKHIEKIAREREWVLLERKVWRDGHRVPSLGRKCYGVIKVRNRIPLFDCFYYGLQTSDKVTQLMTEDMLKENEERRSKSKRP